MKIKAIYIKAYESEYIRMKMYCLRAGKTLQIGVREAMKEYLDLRKVGK